eukprot:TRINITY_DN7440_c1_g1_i1.p1 TRINITY_DN7440_c1_g1~~TRINITY_DN7440_c1_g1_i1.p1  ORF type:complete len:373 (+),score=119.32 TRINITY_DN7440_c1_g1_i1:94-1119(+)
MAPRRDLLLLALVTVAAVELGRRRKRRRGGKDIPLKYHPLFTWLLENACVVGPTLLALRLVPPPPGRQAPLRSILSQLALLTCSAEGLMLCQGLVSNAVYPEIRPFGKAERMVIPPRVLFQDWLSCNFPTFIVAVVIIMTGALGAPPEEFNYSFRTMGIKGLPSFLGKLLIARVVVDWLFYAGHRALHHPKLYWLHERHHEHKKPVLGTNYHFSVPDLLTEAAMPSTSALLVLMALNLPTTRTETTLLFNYMTWHEMSSHSGKPLPTMSWLPPLAPVYQLAFGNVDSGAQRHHDLHHALLACNYSISPWPDLVMGTCRPRQLFPSGKSEGVYRGEDWGDIE